MDYIENHILFQSCSEPDEGEDMEKSSSECGTAQENGSSSSSKRRKGKKASKSKEARGQSSSSHDLDEESPKKRVRRNLAIYDGQKYIHSANDEGVCSILRSNGI